MSKYLEKTAYGYYKVSYLRLINKELYLYKNNAKD